MAKVPQTRPAEGVELTLSASQINTAWDCERKWYFDKVLKLPAPAQQYLHFGTVLHSVLERYLLADNLGYLNGEPVDLYPETPSPWYEVWEWVKQPEGSAAEDGDRIDHEGRVYKLKCMGQLAPAERALIRKLVTSAIEQGIVERVVGRKVEEEFRLPIIDGVDLTGFMDLRVPAGIDDFKSAKNTRYLKQDGPKEADGTPIVIDAGAGPERSPNCVGDEQQMLTYAYVHLNDLMDRAGDGWVPPPVRLRHIQFLKDSKAKDGVRVAEAWVSPERVLEHWEEIKKTAAKLLALHREGPKRAWETVPGPVDGNTCAKYGGCPRLSICSRQESPEMARARVLRLNENSNPSKQEPTQSSTPSPVSNNQKETHVTKDLFARKPGGAPAINPTPAPVAAPAAPAVTTAVATTYRVAPWARPDCGACAQKDGAGQPIKGTGSGINPKQGPCMICDSMQKKAGATTSSMFTLTHDAAGQLQWESKVGAVIGATVAPAPAATPAPAPAAQRALGPEATPAPAPAKGKNLFAARPGAPAPAAPAAQPAPPSMPSAPPELRTQPAPAQAAPEAPAEPSVEAAPEPSSAEATEAPEADAAGKKKAGRPRVGFTLLIDAAVLVAPGGRPAITLQSLIAEYGAQLAATSGEPYGFWALDAFKRRDMLARVAPQIAEKLGTSIVSCSSGDPDSRALMNALMPFATLVIQGVR